MGYVAIINNESEWANVTWKLFKKRIKHSWQLYVIFLLPLIYILLFNYGPMYGIQIAFKDYSYQTGIWNSPWVGLKHFNRFIGLRNFWQIIFNTVGISVYSLLVGTPIPILFAFMLNECPSQRYKKFIQTVSYAPHFISTVVMVSMIIMFLSVNNGVLNNVMALLRFERVNYMGKAAAFKSIYVWSGIWQGMGYSSVIYLAALTAVDPSLYEAAYIDGATRLHKIRYIDFPSILPTVIIMAILGCGNLMSVGFEKIYLMQNSLNLNSSEVISTYVYKQGIDNANYSYSTTVSLFNSIVNLILLVTVNGIAKKVSETSLW